MYCLQSKYKFLSNPCPSKLDLIQVLKQHLIICPSTPSHALLSDAFSSRFPQLNDPSSFRLPQCPSSGSHSTVYCASSPNLCTGVTASTTTQQSPAQSFSPKRRSSTSWVSAHRKPWRYSIQLSSGLQRPLLSSTPTFPSLFSIPKVGRFQCF